MTKTLLPSVNGLTASVNVYSDAATRIMLSEQDFVQGRSGGSVDLSRTVVVEAKGGGHAGADASGAIVYLPAPGFVGEEKLSVRAMDASGAVVDAEITVKVAAGPNRGGASDGEHYVLARDADGWSLPEPGDNHRVVYVSPDGRADADGLTPGTAITPGALDRMLKAGLGDPKSTAGAVDGSWHVLFERGHDYGAFAPPVRSGEDALHPFVVGAYGDGERPLFGASIRLWKDESNVVIRDVAFGYSDVAAQTAPFQRVAGIDILYGGKTNILIENVLVEPVNTTMRVQGTAENVTFYRTMVLDAHNTVPLNGAATWGAPSANRVSGVYVEAADGLLIEQSLFDHNGWEDGYVVAGGDAASPHPPSKYSQNIYIHQSATNLTVRDTITSNAASFGLQARPGGVVDGLVAFGNNVGMNMFGGFDAPDGTAYGDRGLIIDTIITDPSTKDSPYIGARGWGAQVAGPGVIVDSIVAQDGDPVDVVPYTIEQPLVLLPVAGVTFASDGTTVYNWGRSFDVLPGRALPSDAALAGVTIDGFARSVLGGASDSDDLLDLLRARDRATWSATPDAAEIVDFFQRGFGYSAELTAPRRVVFAADPRSEGYRWDNRLNWSSEQGPASGDQVALDGHWVRFGGETLSLAGLDLGNGGALDVSQGRLEVAPSNALTAGPGGGLIEVSNAGQFLFRGHGAATALAVDLSGGRVVNTGHVQGGVDAVISAGQLVLAQDTGSWRVSDGDLLVIKGTAGKVGFDGVASYADLYLDGGELRFVFGADGVSMIREFTSGRFGTAQPEVFSTLDLRSGGDLVIDLSAYAGGAAGTRHTLVDVDRIRGDVSNVNVVLVGAPSGVTPVVGLDAATQDLYLEFHAGTGPGAPAPADLAAHRADPRWRALVDWTDAHGPLDGPRADLEGRWVSLGGGDQRVGSLALGNDGLLAVSAGSLEVSRSYSLTTGPSGGWIDVSDEGAFIFKGYGGDAPLTIDSFGGRVVNNGHVQGNVDATIRDGQFIFADAGGSWRVAEGDTVIIRGDAAEVGFDGVRSTADLYMSGGDLSFIFDESGVSAIREFTSGRFGVSAPAVTTSFDMRSGGGLIVDISAYEGPVAGTRHTLIDVDRLRGGLSDLDIQVIGAPEGLSAKIGVDGLTQSVFVELF